MAAAAAASPYSLVRRSLASLSYGNVSVSRRFSSTVADSSLKTEGESPPVEAGVVDIESPLSESKLRYAPTTLLHRCILDFTFL